MVKGLNRKSKQVIELVFVGLIFMLFAAVAGKYFYPTYARMAAERKIEQHELYKSTLMPLPTYCQIGQKAVHHPEGLLCRNEVNPSVWQSIFDTYQIDPKGRSRIFEFLNTGKVEVADGYLQDLHHVQRFEPVKIEQPMTWTEDPYNAGYWRFIFDSLRSTEHLLFVWEDTGKPEYKDKFVQIMQSFLDVGMKQPEMWDDNHSVAWRSMVMVDAWWRLRQHGALTVEMSTQMLQALQKHGDYLADRNHYDAGNNHGINETAALYLLAVNFPDIPGAADWRTLAEERLYGSLIQVDAVDADGVLMENSPYYHMYSLEKYWVILKYADEQGLSFKSGVYDKVKQMISYATYMIQPNTQVPLLGASLKRGMHDTGLEKEMAVENPEFKYVLTQGKKGKQPSQLSVHYPVAGQTILRSGWGTPDTYAKQTQIIFDVGAYRTSHSDYDALSFNLYSQGITLMPDAGLFTYDDGPDRQYFKGTSAHNTVTVDGKTQKQGTAVAGEFKQGDGYAYQTASHKLYDGVTHDRAISLLGDRLVLVVDHMRSEEEHQYDQIFHLFPGATIEKNGLDVLGYTDKESGKQISIHQLLTDGISLSTAIGETNPLKGQCSEEYAKLLPCHAINYGQKGTNVDFITLLEIGKPSKHLETTLSEDGSKVTIVYGNATYVVNIAVIPGIESKIGVSDNVVAPLSSKPLVGYTDLSTWTLSTEKDVVGGSLTLDKKAGELALALTSSKNGKWVQAERAVELDLSQKNMMIRLHMENAGQLQNFELGLANDDDWENAATVLLSNAYRPEYSGEWLNISIGKSQLRKQGGQWSIRGEDFDWSKVTKLRLRVRSNPGTSATLRTNKFAVLPGQKEGNVIIIFDDGYMSIKPAVAKMAALGFPGNVGVISERVENKIHGYLGLKDLMEMKSAGWDMINHSHWHMDAVNDYYKADNLRGYEEDVLKGAAYMKDVGLDSNPNWYIYPHGSTNETIKGIVGKYYKFARVVVAMPEVYPFADNMAVKTFPMHNDTLAADAIAAIADAKKYRTTLFLTFHRIHSVPSDRPGYPIEDFNRVMDYIAKVGMKPLTLSEFDAKNGTTENDISFDHGRHEQIGITVEKSGQVRTQLNGFLSFFKF